MRNPALNCTPDTNPLHSIARTLTVALGQRDHHTRAHSDRVVQLAAGLGYHIGLNEEEIELLALGAQFHDIGKIGIPDRVLHKPASFEEEEWACMKQHAEIGERIILAIDGDKASTVAKTVRHHHEHFDGSGYPDRLSGTDIPLYARIISLTDSYDAMIDTRAYQRARSHRVVMGILEQESGVKHDPDLLHAFTSAIEKSSLRGKDA
ncbi:MAG: HD domain-containing protein [Azonexaceae bacterium]|nr:HD domain-containing protein [Azonexaceae bacterium]